MVDLDNIETPPMGVEIKQGFKCLSNIEFKLDSFTYFEKRY